MVAPGRHKGSRLKAFTLIELLVAVGISVVLLAILTFVFRVSTAASRTATSRVSLTERLRSLNMRMRQEIGGMLEVDALPASTRETWAKAKKPPQYTCCAVRDKGAAITFTASTNQDGKAVTVDVAYVYEPGTRESPEQGRLIRLRDATGPEVDSMTAAEKTARGLPATATYCLGDDLFLDCLDKAKSLKDIIALTEAADLDPNIAVRDVMITNVRLANFDDVYVELPDDRANAIKPLTDRKLPGAIKLRIRFGPEVGEMDMVEEEEIYFLVPRGL
jgi:prepilin-type N-terminal cleavage/methylation domain-containing protein